jgi:CTP:molybdopterin cytidylyltransferase MocA
MIRWNAVILAAGRSTRAEGPKALRRIGDRSWIEALVLHYGALGAVRIAVTWNPSVSHDIAISRYRDVTIVDNHEWSRGMRHSAALGIAAVGTELPLLLAPVDTVPPKALLAATLLEAIGRGAPAAAPSFEGKGGHPVALSARLAASLTRHGEDVPLDSFLRDSGLEKVPCDDPDTVRNLNDEAAWREWLRNHRPG